ncbi:MAG: DEAD/DEAH box helicase family protein, partial [Bdellovibrionaceae bacterium]|nr:DEAD/DEAH box helicase family protein [Pseudobdellovibrionaceae bacterium]
MDKKQLTEADIRTKFITPAIVNQGKWDVMTQMREEIYFTKGRVIVRGKKVARGEGKKADYILYYKPGIPIAVVEAKDNNYEVGGGMQQALEYAEVLDVPFAFSSNGDAFLEHDRTGTGTTVERHVPLDQFPTPEELWTRYRAAKGYTPAQEVVATQDYFDDGSGKLPRYYQQIAINRTVDAIAQGQDRILLVMATGTGKTYTAFQIIWRLWKSKAKKRILFLVDRNILADQTRTNDFKPFGKAMTKITDRTVDKSFEIYLCLYQAVTGTDEESNIYKQFSPDFFDLIVVDECHRGSAADDASWRRVLEYFTSATQIGMTATPKETKDVSNMEYFGAPLYTYSLKQGISDGFLAPYKVVRIGLDRDLDGWRPEAGLKDRFGQVVEDREYNDKDFDRTLILKKRTETVAAKVTEFLKATDRFAKTIIFCENIDHAERMRQAMVNANPDLAAANSKYVMRITGDNDEGKAQLDHFIDPESIYPVIATTSKLMSTGVDAQTCHLIVLDKQIKSMTEFKQIIGRGTRTFEGKDYFTVYDFVKAYEHFNDPEWDGEPLPPEDPRKPSKSKKSDEGSPNEPPPVEEPPPERIVVKLSDGKERSIRYLAATTYWHEGRQITAQEFMQQLFGDLDGLVEDEDELRTIWSDPDKREAL